MCITHNQRGLFLCLALLASLASPFLFLSCGTYIWVTEKEKPGIAALATAKALGVGQFAIDIQDDPHALVKINDNIDEWSIVGGIAGTTNEAHVIIKSPEAASDFAVREELLRKIVQDNLVAWLSGKKSFTMSAVTGWHLERITDQDTEGMKIEDLPAVVNMTQVVDSLMESEKVISLGEQYDVDLILGGEIKVTAEILKATDEPNKDSVTIGDAPLKVAGEYGLLIDITFDYGLYDAKSGALITDSRKTTTKYVNPSLIENNIIGLTTVPAGNYAALIEFLNSPTYLQLYEDRLNTLLLNYLYLFRSHYRSFQQKVEK